MSAPPDSAKGKVRGDLLTSLLRDVSRSFYLTLRVLPGPVRQQIGVAYLLARATDTVADTEILSLKVRPETLQKLRARILGEAKPALDLGLIAEKQGTAGERTLLKRIEEALHLLETLPQSDRALVREVLATITSGQELDLQRFTQADSRNIIALQADAELDDYTYRVAGCVGEFWTKMCLAHLSAPASVNHEKLIQNGIRFGKGLQLVNILRDISADLLKGRCYIPSKALAAARLRPADLTNTWNMAKFRPLYEQYLIYNPGKAPAMYVPALDGGRRVAKDPVSGKLAIAPLIGLYVPGTGDPLNGMAVGGVNGYPVGLYKRPFISLGPRFGFAYDLFGTGKTALRGGWGWFYDTGQNNPFAASIGNPPIAYSPTLYYGNLESFAQSGGALGPQDLTSMVGYQKPSETMNFSLGLQHQVWGTVIDASYVGALGRHQFLRRMTNPLPVYARFDPANFDPTQPGRPLPDNFLRPYKGYGNLLVYEHTGNSNYNSLQLTANRRFTRGLQFGVAYTFSRLLGYASGDGDTLSPYFSPRARNYGPLTFDRTHTLVFNYMYDLPKIGRKTGWKPATWVLDNWQLSGITSFISGAPFTPGFSTVDGQDITGSSEGSRINVVGAGALPKSERTFFRNFNVDAFARPGLRDFGNAGVNILRGPGINNWDINVGKRIPLFSESRFLQFRTELFNAWNHTQFTGLFTTARFDATGKQTDTNFGAYSSARSSRIIQLSLKVVF